MKLPRITTVALSLALIALPATAVELLRSTMDAGGTSAGGTLSLTGTIGQPDAGFASGGTLELAGGFWSGNEVATAVAEDGLPDINRLEGAVPNPFNPATTLHFDLARPGEASLKLYTLRGRHVRTLVNEVLEAGSHEITWDGCDDDGRFVAGGVYVVQMRAPGFAAVQKISLVK